MHKILNIIIKFSFPNVKPNVDMSLSTAGASICASEGAIFTRTFGWGVGGYQWRRRQGH